MTLATGARGKPRVEAPEGLRGLEFSVSHCDGLTAVVVSASGACGIDVEDENRRIGTDVGAFARRWLSEREAARLDRIEDVDERARAFMRLWTVKEAYVKALGLGIALCLRVERLPGKGDDWIEHLRVLDEEPHLWHRHFGALAVAGH